MKASTAGLLIAVVVLPVGEARSQVCEYPIADLAKCMKRTARMGHVPTVSTPPCGPEGFALGATVPQGFGAASYEAACGGHDICYEICNSVKADCDKTFHDQMIASCRAAYPYPSSGEDEEYARRGTCLARARLFAGLVAGKGQAAYDAAQKVACECCPPTYQGTVDFTLWPASGGYLISGHATVTWLSFESLADVRRYQPTGTITADVTLENCDPAPGVTVPIRTGTPAFPGTRWRSSPARAALRTSTSSPSPATGRSPRAAARPGLPLPSPRR